MEKGIDKAAERALEAYPICKVKSFGPLPGGGISEIDMNQAARNTYLEGYHQAEKDLELTWKDIGIIDKLLWDLSIEWSGKKDNEGYFKEVLKRFKERKEK